MKNLQKFAIPAAVLAGAMAGATPVFADEAKQNNQNVSIVSGHNVIDAVDDLRETTADLVGAVMEAKESFTFSDWSAAENRLQAIERDLDTMERTLDKKAEASDSSWLNWIEDRDYSVTVKSQVETLAQHLNELVSVLSDTKGGKQAQIIVSHNLVDQVDDVRETVGDLLQAISDAGPQLGWFDDAEQFSSELGQLDQMEKSLDRKAEMTDKEWEGFVTSPDYRVTVHDNINTLANMVKNIAGQLSGRSQVTQAE